MYTSVSTSVFRGPRPTPEDFGYIKQTFKQIISLEGAAEDAQEVIDLYPTVVLSFPISTWDIYFSGITTTRLTEILMGINSSPRPVLIHCQYGRDRTGLVIAAYRVTVQGWSKDSAMKEAVDMGYHRILNMGLNKTWEKFGNS